MGRSADIEKERRILKKWLIVMAAAMPVLLGAAACSSGGGSASSGAGSPVSGSQISDSGQDAPGQPAGVKLCEVGESGEGNESGESAGAEAGETKIPYITINVTDSAITLSAPLVNSGPLEMQVSNAGVAEHTIVISGPIQGNTGPVKPGETANMRGRIAAGDYQIYSVKDNQKEAGLEVALKVQ